MACDYSGVNATRTNASECAKEYATLLNETAAMIHQLDPNHPVAVGNIELGLADYYAKYAPEIDILALNAYRGKRGFGDLWDQAKKVFDRPVVILEYGCDSYDQRAECESEEAQYDYHKGCWADIAANSAQGPGAGNSIGGVVFEWLDEWWKDTQSGDSPSHQNTDSQLQMPFPDGFSNEEWFGIAGQEDGSQSPYLRDLKKTYYFYKDVWNKK
jgi:beta-glucuronidase